MFTNVWRRRGVAALAAVCAAGALAACDGANIGAARAQTQAHTLTQTQTRVPWARVGPGWELAEYTNATQTKHAPVALYLVSPGGTRYALYTWRTPASAPSLVDWSGDKTRALFYDPAGNQMMQLNLLTGKKSSWFRLAGHAVPAGYTRPAGLNILGVRADGSVVTLARYSLVGKLVKVLATSTDFSINGVDSAGGTTLAISGSTGLRLISNAGRIIRQLPVPGTDPKLGCSPVRWWNARIVLSQCFGKKAAIARLWLVPASGARPVALTPQRTQSGYDLGDIDTWRLSSGLFLQSAGACGTLEFNKQNANGSVSPVKVPGTLNVSSRLVTAMGPRLLVDAITGCRGSQSLLWFNPGTRAEQWLFKTPANALGVLGVTPYYTQEIAPAA